ncbi:hypothetical protein ACFQZE_08380 [Paenibacillus sp. GCM10027627]|uniref:hypothetical protein n=1 Tax=unclassified Paenibacillus TaxID=185978 RepID=UPI00363B5D27
MNALTILRQLFRKLTKDEVASILNERSMLPNKYKKKKELENYFLALSNIIEPEEVKDLVEMAVLKKTKGLSAYTHKLVSLNGIDKQDISKLMKDFQKKDHPFTDIYTFTLTVDSLQDSVLTLTFRIKEYAEFWKTGERNLGNLSAIYNCPVVINMNSKVLTIFSGDDTIHGLIDRYIGEIMKLPIQVYRIMEKTSALTWNDNASYKTTLFLDFIYNRLKDAGLSSSFSKLKFKIDNSDAEDVTISGNGNNLINYELACEYISLGKDILQFKINASYEKENFSCYFSLKGKNLDVLKIVVNDLQDDKVKQKVIEFLQKEYIEMCNEGIKNLKNIQDRLQQIYRKFVEKNTPY